MPNKPDVFWGWRAETNSSQWPINYQANFFSTVSEQDEDGAGGKASPERAAGLGDFTIITEHVHTQNLWWSRSEKAAAV